MIGLCALNGIALCIQVCVCGGGGGEIAVLLVCIVHRNILGSGRCGWYASPDGIFIVVVLFIWNLLDGSLSLAQVKGVMRNNIEKVAQRGEKLEDLGERAGEDLMLRLWGLMWCM